jgi:Domain of unknown function (DUF4382)/Carboxypeptidase regulatory-like domain
MKQVMRFCSSLAGFALLVAGASACSDTNGAGETPRVRVLLTDAPSVEFETAVVSVGEISLLPADGGDAVVLTDVGGDFDLLQLQNGVTVTIADAEIDPGQYVQLRMKVLDANVTLAEGYEFVGGGTTMSLKIPSGAQSGIKVHLHPAGQDEPGMDGIEITGETTLVVDFDVSQNFKIQGNPNTPAGLKGVLFTPSLRAVVSEGAGTISGTVTDDQDAAVAGATVTAALQGMSAMGDGETSLTTAVTADDGTYTIRFVLPGTYDVSVDAAGTVVGPQTVTVTTDEDVTGVDFTVPTS